MVTAYLALGSNLGNREAALRGAREALDDIPGVEVAASSSLYETDPVGGPAGQGPFLNAVLRVKTTLSAPVLLQHCLAVEDCFGRRRLEHWGPRTLDVDLLLYGGKILRLPGLEVPHPRLHQRPFVLLPLLELAPDLTHPALGRTVRDLAGDLPSASGVRRLTDTW
ncbi:MAG: 2-amino-4-hydroxy-6-hydroxymethyldihydropteridine diphosphokinase [Desulfuromonadales bacterium]|jgi:2-amino-4-hydroxy-6-hydroxymethyldihydropteridine diphosphokinase